MAVGTNMTWKRSGVEDLMIHIVNVEAGAMDCEEDRNRIAEGIAFDIKGFKGSIYFLVDRKWREDYHTTI